MFGFFKSADKRIILINSEGLSVYSLEHGRLVHSAKFSEENAGYENFRRYLADKPRSAVTLLIDSVAEDFIVESVVHVRRFDRKALLDRKSDKHYRGTEYRSAKIVGRETTERRDDKVLFSAITKNQSLDPWVKVLLEKEIPIKSITTPAYALCKVAKEFGLLTRNTVLLVNWEESGIRQTLIVDGKVMFSRLTPLPYDANADLAEAIVDSCKQSKEYLERIGLLQYDQLLDVHIITPHLSNDDFSGKIQSGGINSIVHHNSIEMMKIDRFIGPQMSITAILLCLDWAIRRGELENIYAPAAALRFFQLSQIKKLVAVSCLAIFLLAGLVSAPLVLDGITRQAHASQLIMDIRPVQGQYDALVAEFPDTPIPSEAMELAVQTYNVIESQVQSPIELMATVSAVIAQHPAVKLSSIEWGLMENQTAGDFTTAILNEETAIYVDIYGTLVDSKSAQDSDQRLRQLMESFNQLGGLTVSPITLPIDPGPSAEISTTIDDEMVDAEFALSLRPGS